MSANPDNRPTIAMRPVDSSHLASVGHDEQSSTLQVAFRKGGLYQYHGVARATYNALLAAKSKGQFFRNNIQTKFKSTAIARQPKAKK